LHFLKHVPGQKDRTFFPPVSGCTLLHLFLGLIATNDAHVFEGSPLNLNKVESSHSLVGAELGPALGIELGNGLGTALGTMLGE
jgi:hypothetical protein